jgi:hypothetical protein
LWEFSKGWALVPECATQTRVSEVGPDRILVLCQGESNKQIESAALAEIKDNTTPWIHAIANSPSYIEAHKVYVAAHLDFVDLRIVASEIQRNRYAGGAFFKHELGTNKSPLFEDLVKLFELRDQDSFETAIEAIIRDQELTRKQRLANLKHQLNHVFLPLVVNLHAWREVEYDDDFMNELVSSSNGNDGHMERARSFLYEQAAAPNSDTIERLVKECNLESDSAWEAIEDLLPRRDPRLFKKGVVAVLESLKDKDKLKALRTRMLNDDDPLTEWTNQLESALTELAKKIA